MYLDYKSIFDYTQVTMEYLFIDKADIEPGKSGHGSKHCSMQDWYFKIHFPDNPIMPGVLIMESIMETGTLILSTMPDKKKKYIMFCACDNVKITGEVRPGDILETDVELLKYRRGVAKLNGKAYVKNKEIAKMDFTLVVTDEIILRAEQSRAE